MKRKNILLLMTDQQRPEYVGWAPDAKIETPHLDRIAEGMAFTCCQTVNPVCTPARTALITGKYTRQIGTLAMSGDLSLEHPTYMQALQNAGYWTAGIGKFHFLQTWQWGRARGKGVNLTGIKEEIKKFGYDHVWETSGKQLATRNYCDWAEHLDKKGVLTRYRDFVDACGPNFNTPDGRPDEDGNPWPFDEGDHVDIMTGDKIIEAIETAPADKPFYVFGSFCSPHRPFDPPQRFLDMVPEEEADDFIPGEKDLTPDDRKLLYKKRRAYKALIKLVDEQVGRIITCLEKKGVLDDTVILFTCDHGEMLGDHFRIQKSEPWQASATVPTAVRHPDHLTGTVNHTPVSIIDIAGTILDVAGLDSREALSRDWPAFNNIVPCRSLMPVISGAAPNIRDYTFCEYQDKWQMIQTDKWKYVRYMQYDEPGTAPELFFDLENDPDEITDLIGNPSWADIIQWCRDRRDYIMDHTPAAQTRWAPLMD